MTYPEHIQWIIDNRSEDLMKVLSCDNSYKTIDNPFKVFLDADPTEKKKLTQWLVDTYINSGFKWEDIQSGSNSKVFDTLSLYVKHKSKLDSTNHIGQYDNLGSIYKDIAPFIKSDKSSRSVKHDAQTQAYEESEILVKSESLTVVIPKTEYASKWWGKGTRWCTAGDNNNVFEGYYKDGPLIIIIVNGVKTQLHVDLVDKDRSVQFMDEHDNSIKIDFIEDNWTLLSPIMLWALKQNILTFQYIPDTLMTAEVCLDAVKQNGKILRYVPEYLRTAELCLEAVKSNGKSLFFIPKILITPELCLEAVRQDGWALRHVTKDLRTPELCLEAVRQNGRALYYVPENLITTELCLDAVRQNGGALRHVPEELRTPDLYLEAVRQNGDVLDYIAERLKTAQLCLEAVRQNGDALFAVPKPLKTAKLCMEAVMQNGRALEDVPKSLRLAELCLEAVKQNGDALCYVPKPLRTAELCLEAVKQDGMALYYFPEPLITLELCLEAVKQNGEALCYVPEPLRLALSKNYSINKNILNKWDFSFLKELKLELENTNHLKLDQNTLS